MYGSVNVKTLTRLKNNNNLNVRFLVIFAESFALEMRKWTYVGVGHTSDSL